jgi:hypothetical protein
MIKFEEIRNILKDWKKDDVIEYAEILYEYYYLKLEPDYTKLSDDVLGLLAVTIGVSYKNMHPTIESQLKQPYKEWIKYMQESKCKFIEEDN